MNDQEVLDALKDYGRFEVFQSDIEEKTEKELANRYREEFKSYQSLWNKKTGRVVNDCHHGFRRFLRGVGLKPHGNHKLVVTRSNQIKWIRCDTSQRITDGK